MSQQITQLLTAWSEGDEAALEALVPLVYDHMHATAARLMRSERSDHTLQATALVHEAYARLSDGQKPQWRSSEHFIAVAAMVMRRILIDHARGLGRQRRGGGQEMLSLDDALVVAPEKATALLDLDEALDRLAKVDARKAKVVELKFFGGLRGHEIARLLKVGPATVAREWRLARAWLARELESAMHEKDGSG